MKLTIIGRGNAGCISAMHFAYYRNYLNFPLEIEIVYDSKINPVPTGQGSTLDFSKLLFNNFNLEYVNKFPVTVKTGIMYENFGKKNKKIFHGFPLGNYALHFEPKSFQDFVCKNLKINFIERDENVKNYHEIDSDYIIDCSGAPNNLKNYQKLLNPLNCALLADLPAKKNDVKYTRSIAHKNGWCFYIPLPKRTSLGYIFNDKITSLEDAKKDFIKSFNIEKINRVFPFKQYVANKPIDKRVLLNGNKLFFLEPLEATAMGTYMDTARFHFDYMFNNISEEISNKNILDYINKIQNFILWHYASGSSYDTIFWKKAKELWEKNPKEDIEKIILQIKGMSKTKCQLTEFAYAQWTFWNFKIWYEGIN